jgi:hypothetical protein
LKKLRWYSFYIIFISLKISNLRDKWDDYFVSQVFDDLEVLAPPKEQGDFKLFLYYKGSFEQTLFEKTQVV